MQNNILSLCQGRSGEDRAEGQQEPEWCQSHLRCIKVWGYVCISQIWPVFLPYFHHSAAIRKRKIKPCEISSRGKTHPCSEWKTFLQAWPQVFKHMCRAVRECRKTVTRQRGLKYQAATAALGLDGLQ